VGVRVVVPVIDRESVCEGKGQGVGVEERQSDVVAEEEGLDRGERL